MGQIIAIIIIVLMVLIPSIMIRIKLDKKKTMQKPLLFQQMRQAAERAVPQTKGYPVVMAQAEKDTMSILKEAGGDFAKKFAVAAVGAALGVRANLYTYSDHLPQFILAYQGDEIYAICVDRPGFGDIEVNPDCILHLTRQTVEKVKLGATGRMTFFLEGGTRFIVTVSEVAASGIGQGQEQKDFKVFIGRFAQVINE